MPYDRGHVIISRNGWTCEECGLPVTGATDIMGAPVIEGDAIKHVVDEIKETEDIVNWWDEGAFRASGEVICIECGKEYWKHPQVAKDEVPTLVRGCDGKLLKL